MTEMNKKTIYLLTVLLALLSCSREPIAPDITPDADWETPSDETLVTHELTAVYPSGTRTSYSDDADDNFAWEDGDEIAIMMDDRSIVKGTLTLTSDPKVAKVTYSAPSGRTRAYHAIYPYSQFRAPRVSEGESWTDYGDELRYVYYPLVYDISSIVAGNGTGTNGETYNTCSLPMFAGNTEGDNQLLFNHLADLLRIECDNVPSNVRVLSVRSTSASGECLGGTFMYPLDGNHLDYGYINYNYASDDNDNNIHFSIGALSEETDGIVLNVPLGNIGHEYHGFKVTAFDGSNSIIRQSCLDWANPGSAAPGRGYRYDISLNQVDENGPYVDISFAGGNKGDGVSCQQSSTNYGPGYPITTSDFLLSQAMVYISGVYASSASSPTLTNYTDRVKLVCNSLTPNIKITFSTIFKVEPRIIPTKIGIRCCKSSNSGTMRVGFNDSSQAIDMTIPSSVSNVLFTPDASWVSTGLDELYISSNETMDIYSIRIYF